MDGSPAAEDVSTIGEAVRAAGWRLPQTWLPDFLHPLKREGPERVFAHLARLCHRCASPEIQRCVGSLMRRPDQMQSQHFQETGWPLGSGMGEWANRLVVQTRLKGADMHGKRENVYAMHLLRNAVFHDRWDKTWQLAQRQHQQQQVRLRAQHSHQRRERAAADVLSQ